MTIREQITAEALTWERCPYHDGMGVKGLGVDCAYFPLRVYTAVGLIHAPDPKWYSPMEWCSRGSTTYIDELQSKTSAREIEEKNVKPGDLVLWRVPRGTKGSWTHGGIVIRWPEYVLHPLKEFGVTASNANTDGFLIHRPRRFFTFVEE